MRVAVIGAGPAGMTAAYELSRRGAQVQVFEASDRMGGLARSLDLWGQRVDLGPHRFFSSDARVNRLWLEVVGREYKMVERMTRIYYQGRLFRYPLMPLDALAKMGPVNAARCLLSYAKQKLTRQHAANRDESFETWVVSRFGRRLFEMFFKSYSEKLWGIPCDELDADFAAQRINKFSLGEAVRSALSPRRRARHRTLVDRFAYPLGGTGSVYEKMALGVERFGGQVHLQCPVTRVVQEDGHVRGVELHDGRFEPADRVISTMPLTLLIQGLSGVPQEVRQAAAALTFRNTVLVYLHVDGRELFPDQWIYLHAPELQMGRVTNYRNWVSELYGQASTTILAAEYWCNSSDAMWTDSDERLIELATRELRSTGLLGSAAVLAGHVVRVPRCYPVYARGYRLHLRQVMDYVHTVRGLSPIGRYGAFKYNNQDHSILLGIFAAENLLANEHHDLWSVNTDYDRYQESALITDTGLVEQPAP
ncbi:MAG: FAD-dependent oxidoreductase [Pirellulales bacterium]